jgi:flagellar hook-associated protein 3 FlgL
MRISTAYQFGSYSDRIQESQSRYYEAQQQVLTGKRFERPSEDPVGAFFSIDARSVRSRISQLDSNLRSAKEYIGLTDNALSEVSTSVTKAYELAVRGANSTYDQKARDGMASEVAELQKRLVSLANSQGSNGQYIFAGHHASTKPFTVNGSTVDFNGDTNPVSVEVRPGDAPMKVNLDNADTFFKDIYDKLETLKNDLQTGDLTKISGTDISATQSAIKAVQGARADIGLKSQTITAQAAENQRRIDDLTTRISDVEEVDMAEAVTRMKSAEVTYNAALQVTSKGYQLSLMDFIR